VKRETAVISGVREGVATRGVVRWRTLVGRGGRAEELGGQRLDGSPGGLVEEGGEGVGG